LIAEKPRLLGAQSDDLADQRTVVTVALMGTARGPRLPQGPAVIASAREGQKRLDRRTRERHRKARARPRPRLLPLAQTPAARRGRPRRGPAASFARPAARSVRTGCAASRGAR